MKAAAEADTASDDRESDDETHGIPLCIVSRRTKRVWPRLVQMVLKMRCRPKDCIRAAVRSARKHGALDPSVARPLPGVQVD